MTSAHSRRALLFWVSLAFDVGASALMLHFGAWPIAVAAAAYISGWYAHKGIGKGSARDE